MRTEQDKGESLKEINKTQWETYVFCRVHLIQENMQFKFRSLLPPLWVFYFYFISIFFMKRTLCKCIDWYGARTYQIAALGYVSRTNHDSPSTDYINFNGVKWISFDRVTLIRIRCKDGIQAWLSNVPQCYNHLVHLLKPELFWSRLYNLSLIVTPLI